MRALGAGLCNVHQRTSTGIFERVTHCLLTAGFNCYDISYSVSKLVWALVGTLDTTYMPQTDNGIFWRLYKRRFSPCDWRYWTYQTYHHYCTRPDLTITTV